MNISQKGIDLIKQFEGCRLKAYKPVPTEKYWTIGYGHYGPDVKEGATITQQQAEELLKHDLEKFSIGVASLINAEVNQNQFDALVSFAYNCGTGALKNSDLLKCINEKNFTNAASEFAKWTHSGKTVLAGLVKRREAERVLFTTEIPKPVAPAVSVHIVKQGDNVTKIAVKYGTTVQKIKELNKLDNPNLIHAGQKLRVK